MPEANEPLSQAGENGESPDVTTEDVVVAGRRMVIIRRGEMVTLEPKPTASVEPTGTTGPRLFRRNRADHGNIIARVLLPWRAAKFLFKPRVGTSRTDRVLDRLAFWRATTGLLVIMTTTFPYPEYWNGITYDTYRKAAETGKLALFLSPLSFLVMLVVTRPGRRVPLLFGTLRFLRYGVLALAVFLLPIVWLVGGKIPRDGTYALDPLWLPPLSVNNPDPRAAVFFVFVAVPLLLCLILWMVCVWFCTIYWAARTGFWTGELHPLLAPIVTTSVMLLVTGQEIIQPDTEDAPYTLWLMLTLCGAATSLVLSVFEYRHLRSIGHRFRAGPEPVTAD